MAFYAVSTMAGSESEVADSMSGWDSPHIHAVLAPSTLKSYVIVEADGMSPVERAVSDTPKANKVLPGETSPQEVMGYLSPSSRVEDVSEGDVVEVTDGPYTGKNARVERLNHEEETVTVELHEAAIPIPIEIPGDQIRVVD